MNQLAYLVLLLALTCGCRSAAVVIGHAEPDAEPATQVPSDFVLTLQRSECYGECPVYTVTVDAAGNVEYQGTKFVAVIGPARWKVHPEIVVHLWKLLEHVHFLDLEFDCRCIISDVPTQTLTFREDGRERTIANRWGHATEFLFLLDEGDHLSGDFDVHTLLDWLAQWIDIALDTAPYVRGEKPRGFD